MPFSFGIIKDVCGNKTIRTVGVTTMGSDRDQMGAPRL